MQLNIWQVLLVALHTAVCQQFEIPQYLFCFIYSLFLLTIILRKLQIISYPVTFQHQKCSPLSLIPRPYINFPRAKTKLKNFPDAIPIKSLPTGRMEGGRPELNPVLY